MISVILLSGGIGSRMHNSMPKQYMLLAGKPVIMHTIERLDLIEKIQDIVIVCSEKYRFTIERMLSQYGIRKSVKFALAGQTRQESVWVGLTLVETQNVLIHEAARPFVQVEEFDRMIESEEENIITGSRINYTVLKGSTCVNGLLNRSELVNVQLPQKYNTKVLKQAHEMAKKDGSTFTEDASLLFYYNPNECIKIVEGTEYNIKITTPIDMVLGEIIYREYFQRRV